MIAALAEKEIAAIVPVEDWELLGPIEQFPNAAAFSRSTVSLPTYPLLPDAEQDRIIEVCENSLLVTGLTRLDAAAESMILTAHQPVYLPWLGLFHKIALSERFCVFDGVQYQAKDATTKPHQEYAGPICFSVPVDAKHRLNRQICDIKIIPDGWNKKHIKSIRHSYQKAPFFSDYIEILEDYLLGREHVFLTELNTGMLEMFLRLLSIDVPVVRATDFSFVGQNPISSWICAISSELRITFSARRDGMMLMCSFSLKWNPDFFPGL